MARSYANITTGIWRDPEFRALSTAAQRLYLMLLTQADISSCGIVPLTVKRWANNASDSHPDSLSIALAELADTLFVMVDETTEEVLIRTFVKWDGGANNPKRRPAIFAAVQAIQSTELSQVARRELAKLGVTDTTADSLPDSLSDRHPDRPRVGVTLRTEIPQPPTPNPQPGGRGLSDSPPADHCSKHPDGTDGPCGACGRARRNREQWDIRKRESAREFAEYLKSQPECEHGLAGGNIDRPNTDTPSCAQCRRLRKAAS